MLSVVSKFFFVVYETIDNDGDIYAEVIVYFTHITFAGAYSMVFVSNSCWKGLWVPEQFIGYRSKQAR